MTTKIEDGGYAFPSPSDEKAGWHSESGMTMRDWFAGQALAGHYADWGSRSINEIATMAYTMADAMIVARKAGV